MYANCGSPSDAHSLFDIMGKKDPHSWHYIVKAYASNVKDSLQLFQQMMMEGFLLVTSTLMSILAACTGASSLVHGMRIHACTVGSEFLVDVEVENNIINMYNRCEDLRCAMNFFDSMLAYYVVTFNTLITALVQHNKSGGECSEPPTLSRHKDAAADLPPVPKSPLNDEDLVAGEAERSQKNKDIGRDPLAALRFDDGPALISVD
ncbi:hypothetical protein L7F22_025050 [Adiantum nelumboides]|nr:hypothetical protein [Adiantum nelumboides]